MNSILESVKKVLGVSEGDTYFDDEIALDINSVFSVLRQLGVGPDSGFTLDSSNPANTVWTDFMEEGVGLEFVKTYVALKVKQIFDPPSNSSAIDALQRRVDELEWRINVAVDPTEEEIEEMDLDD